MKRSLKLWLLIVLIIFVRLQTFAQGNSVKTELPNGWHLLDKEKDGYYGISIEKAYEFAREKNLKSKTVLVAVIDSGVDTLQEDLKDILWTNPNEIPGNNKDGNDDEETIPPAQGSPPVRNIWLPVWQLGRDGRRYMHGDDDVSRSEEDISHAQSKGLFV